MFDKESPESGMPKAGTNHKMTINFHFFFTIMNHYPSHLVQGKAVDGTHHCGHHQRWRHTNANALSRAGASRRSASFGGAEGGAGRAGRGTRRRAVAGGEPGGAESDGQEKNGVLDCCHFEVILDVNGQVSL